MLDATELGDLLPLAGVEYVTGAESQTETAEPHAVAGPAQPDNVQGFTWCFPVAFDPDGEHVMDRPVQYRRWAEYVPRLSPAWPGRLLDWTHPDPVTLESRRRVLFPHEDPDPYRSLWLYRRLVCADEYAPDARRPELALASWASRHLTPDERAAATMYTSGEHCPMCAAAQVWAGIGRLVFVLSGEMIRTLVGPGASWIQMGAREVIERSNVRVRVEGPCDELISEAAALFRRPAPQAPPPGQQRDIPWRPPPDGRPGAGRPRSARPRRTEPSSVTRTSNPRRAWCARKCAARASALYRALSPTTTMVWPLPRARSMQGHRHLLRVSLGLRQHDSLRAADQPRQEGE